MTLDFTSAWLFYSEGLSKPTAIPVLNWNIFEQNSQQHKVNITGLSLSAFKREYYHTETACAQEERMWHYLRGP